MSVGRKTAKWFERNRIKPIAAGLAVLRLLRDPDDTGQVFKVLEALRGDSLGRGYRRLASDSAGRAVLARRPKIVDSLNDRESLAAMPTGSIGRAYFEFVHAEGLRADELIDSSEQAPRFDKLSSGEVWLAEYLRDIHDLQHVMTGYGRDQLGELCLLSFMTTQTPSRGLDFIIFMARQKYRIEQPEAHGLLRDLVREGADIGRGATWMPLVDWREKLQEPLNALRDELGFRPPELYYALRGKMPGLSNQQPV